MVFEIVQCLSVVIASIVAIAGITSWRREARWKRRYELAEEVLATFYEISDRFEIIRSSAGYVGEGATRKRSENESKEESEILDNAYVIIERYNNEITSFIKLKSLRYRFMTIFGVDSVKPFNEINRLVGQIFIASRQLGLRYWKDQGKRNFSKEEFERHLSEMENWEKIFWSGYNETDQFKIDVDNAILEIEKICRPIIEKK